MMNDTIDKIVAETIEMYNYRMRLESPKLMEQGTEELLDRIRLGMERVAHAAVGAYLEEELAKRIAAREAMEVEE